MATPIADLNPDNIADAVDYIVYQGGSLAYLKGITKDELEAVYAVAYSQFSQHDYEKAEKLFAFLCMYEHREEKHWMGLGASRQNQKNYQGAAAAYGVAALLDIENPLPALQAGECFLAQGTLDMAERAFKVAVHYATQDPKKYEKALGRAEALLSATRTRMEHEGS